MMKRREFLLSMAALTMGPVACDSEDTSTPTPSTAAPSTPVKPNVLFISIDDLNDWVGFLGGHPQVRTPNLDRLAARSTVFDRAYCNAPLCGPSRASVLSGMHPHTTKIFDHNNVDIPAHLKSLPQHFVDNGYVTKLHGKVFHVGENLPHPLPAVYPANNLECSGHPTMPPQGLLDWAELNVEDSATHDGHVTASGISFLSDTHTQPFFLALGYFRPHVSWYVHKKYFDLYPRDQVIIPEVPADELDDLPGAGSAIARFPGSHPCLVKQGLWADAVRAYLACISFVDAQVGLVLDYLDQSPYAANTIIVLWSDNGFHLGEKFHWHKQALWEESTRVPLLISAPKHNISAATVTSNVGLIDLYPTLIDLCGLTPVTGLQGHSLLPLMKQPNMTWEYPILTTYMKNHHAIRYQNWRYIRYEAGGEELYDRSIDPGEHTNLASSSSYADIKKQLAAYMPANI